MPLISTHPLLSSVMVTRAAFFDKKKKTTSPPPTEIGAPFRRVVSEHPEREFRKSAGNIRTTVSPGTRWSGIPEEERIGSLEKLTSDAVTRPFAATSSRSNALFSNTRFFISPLVPRQGVTRRPLRALPGRASSSLSFSVPSSFYLRIPPFSFARSLFLSAGTTGHHLSDGAWRDE